MVDIFKDVLEAMSVEKASQASSGWRVKDLILMLHLNATKSYQKRRLSQEDILCDGTVDRATSFLAEVLRDALEESSRAFPSDSEPMQNLYTLIKRLQIRAERMDRRNNPDNVNNSDDILNLLTEFADDESSRIPFDFMPDLEIRLRDIIDQKYEKKRLKESLSDADMSGIFEGALIAMSNDHFRHLMASERRVKDLILRFHLSATKPYQISKSANRRLFWTGHLRRLSRFLCQPFWTP